MPELVDVTPGSSEWLAARRAGVTATDIVTILGLSTHDSVYSLYWRKLGQVPDEPDRDRWALGRHMEPYIAEKWAEASGVLIRKAPGMYAKPVMRDGGLYQSGDRPWQLATPDRIHYEGKDDISEPVELKSWADADRKSWEAGPPAAVRAQLLWQMDTLDSSVGYWAVVFLPSGRFQHGVIEHDPAFIPDGPDVEYPCPVCQDIRLMRTAGEEFYRRLTLELPPPDLDNSAATLAALRARFTKADGKTAEVDGTVYAAWSDAKDVLKFWKDNVREYEIMLRDQGGEADVLTVNGDPVIRRVVSDSQVKAHTRHADYYRRVQQKNGDDDE